MQFVTSDYISPNYKCHRNIITIMLAIMHETYIFEKYDLTQITVLLNFTWTNYNFEALYHYRKLQFAYHTK